MSQAQPKIVRAGIIALVATTILGPVATVAMPTPPQTDALDPDIVAKFLMLFVQIPVAILTLVLAVFASRGGKVARLLLVFVCLGEVVLAMRTFGVEQFLHDPWSTQFLLLPLLQLVAVSLLFMPKAQMWFSDRERPAGVA